MDDRWALLLFLPCQENDPKDEEDDGEDSTERSGSLVILRDGDQRVVHCRPLVLPVLEPEGIVPFTVERVFKIGRKGFGLNEYLVPGVAILHHGTDGFLIGIVGEPDLGITLSIEIVIIDGSLVVPGFKIGMALPIFLPVLGIEGCEEDEGDDGCNNEEGSKESAHVQPPSL